MNKNNQLKEPCNLKPIQKIICALHSQAKSLKQTLTDCKNTITNLRT